MASGCILVCRFVAVLLLASIEVCSPSSDYDRYEVNGLDAAQSQLPIKILIKRQAPGDGKDAKETKKQQFQKESENSSNAKQESGLPKASDEVAVALNETITTTVAPMTTQIVQDYDGSNVTVNSTTQDFHKYYNSTNYGPEGMKFWVDMDTPNANVHPMLSDSYRRAATINLTFDFPFYGHMVRNITIATGGFLYTGDYVHSWLAATQYIAPLMANFDTSMGNTSHIKYMDNGTAFTVQWANVPLQDRPTGGNFTFQATLLKNGDIIFAYKEIPMNISTIGDDSHPVKVGVSDAYIIDRTIFFVRRKTIYEYHKVDKKTDDIVSNSSIYFTALPTCVSLSSCESCVTNSIGFECVWCPQNERCSDGIDRHRQDWLVKGCEKQFIGKNATCSAATTQSPPITETSTTTSVPTYTKFPSTTTTTTTTEISLKPWDDADSSAVRVDDIPADGSNSHYSVVWVLFIVAMIVGAGGWVFYAYRNPHTPSGQCFIRYRPSQWRWRSGEAHYTAASIHM